MFSFCPNSIRLHSKRAWDRDSPSVALSLFWGKASHGFLGVRTKLSPHHFILPISSPHANTLISIRFCSGQPRSHDISRAKKSTEQICSAQEKPLLLDAFHPWWWSYTHHHVTLWHSARMAAESLKDYMEPLNLKVKYKTVRINCQNQPQRMEQEIPGSYTHTVKSDTFKMVLFF